MTSRISSPLSVGNYLIPTHIIKQETKKPNNTLNLYQTSCFPTRTRPWGQESRTKTTDDGSILKWGTPSENKTRSHDCNAFKKMYIKEEVCNITNTVIQKFLAISITRTEKWQLCCNLHKVLSFPLPEKPIPAMIQYHDSSGYCRKSQYRRFRITLLQTAFSSRWACDLQSLQGTILFS